MTRTEAIAIINASLDAVDDKMLETAAAHLARKIHASAMNVGDIVEAFATDSVLPRALSPRELDLIEQSKADFKAGRTMSSEEMWSSLDDHLASRGVPRSTA